MVLHILFNRVVNQPNNYACAGPDLSIHKALNLIC
jgi:hypothetical protein